jgi:hypothetical protein
MASNRNTMYEIGARCEPPLLPLRRKQRRQNIASKVGRRTEKNRGGSIVFQAITAAGVILVRSAAEAIS